MFYPEFKQLIKEITRLEPIEFKDRKLRHKTFLFPACWIRFTREQEVLLPFEFTSWLERRLLSEHGVRLEDSKKLPGDELMKLFLSLEIPKHEAVK